MRSGPRLVDILMRIDLVTQADLERARARQESRGGSLLESLVLGGVSEVDLARALSGALRMPVVNLQGKRIDPEVLGLVPKALAEKHHCLPLFTKHEQGALTLYLGLEDPTELAVLDEVSSHAGLRVRPVVMGPIQLRSGLRASYPATEPPRAAEPPLSTEPESPAVPPSEAQVGAEGEGPAAAATPLPALSELVRPQLRMEVDDDDTAPQWPEPALAPPASAPAEAVEGAEAGEAEAPEEGSRPKPRDVPTRIILRALLQVLIEKDVITRGELLAAVDEIRGGRYEAEPRD